MSGEATSGRAVAEPLAERRREDIVKSHMPLVGHLVREMLVRVPAHVNRDDLMSAGYAALVAAARGFDTSRGVPFARFAAARVRGALLDELRGLDWASRSVRQRARRADVARQELIAELKRTPTIGEVAAKLGCSVSDLERDMNAFKGNAYGLASTLRQTANLRPSIRSKKVRNLYYTGQFTVPGPGVPPALISGQVVAREILKDMAR